MNARDYNNFANMINKMSKESHFDFMVDYSVAKKQTLDRVVEKMCNIFAEDNPKFDKQRFLDACKKED